MGTANKVGFAVVGLGGIAQSAVLPAFAKCKKAKLVALVSRDKDKAARLARQFQVPHFYGQGEYATCLANPQVAAVYIATPQGEHLEFTVRAAKARKHVLCEKPLAADTTKRRGVKPSTPGLRHVVRNWRMKGTGHRSVKSTSGHVPRTPILEPPHWPAPLGWYWAFSAILLNRHRGGCSKPALE